MNPLDLLQFKMVEKKEKEEGARKGGRGGGGKYSLVNKGSSMQEGGCSQRHLDRSKAGRESKRLNVNSRELQGGSGKWGRRGPRAYMAKMSGLYRSQKLEGVPRSWSLG